MNKEQLEQEIAELTTRIDSIKERLENRKEDLLLLDSDDILSIGTEVRLVRDWNTPEDVKNSYGWRAYLHFMNPQTPAYVSSVEAWNGQIHYLLRFSSNDKAGLFSFKREDFEVLQSGGVLEKEIVKLKKENEDLKIRLNELTSPTDIKNCPHRFVSTCLNTGEPKVFCRYYEGQPCDDADFCNCMFRENTRLKEKFSRITETVKQLIALSDSLVNICDLSLGITSGPIVGDIFMLSKKIQSRVHILGKLNTNL